MERRLGFVEDSHCDVREGWDPNDLLHPAQAFGIRPTLSTIPI
jgi:hypothetical protein